MDLAEQEGRGISMCETEKHPFSHPPLFADPEKIYASGCNGEPLPACKQGNLPTMALSGPRRVGKSLPGTECRVARGLILGTAASVATVVSAEGTLKDVPKQFPRAKPLVISWFRHPVLRTISQVGPATTASADAGVGGCRYQCRVSSEEQRSGTVCVPRSQFNHDQTVEQKRLLLHPDNPGWSYTKHEKTLADLYSNRPGGAQRCLTKRQPEPKCEPDPLFLCWAGVVVHVTPIAEVDRRYKDWYHSRMGSTTYGTFPEAAADYAFIGLTDFYRTSLCLFYFTFQVR